jgi:hypothetical protein
LICRAAAARRLELDSPAKAVHNGHQGTALQTNVVLRFQRWKECIMHSTRPHVVLIAASAIAICLLPLHALRAAEPKGYSVREYGATGQGKELDTAAINACIEACAKAGGGKVVFPEGTYLSGSIHLKSNVRLDLEEKATILGAPNNSKAYDPPEPNPWDKYQDFGHSHFHNALLWGEKLENVTISGKGTIRGEGLTRKNQVPDRGGDKAISLKLCKNIVVEGVSILKGGHFAVLATGCDGLKIRNVTIRTGRDSVNIVGCRNVEISDSEIRSLGDNIEGEKPEGGGDDVLALKSDFSLGRKLLSENIVVRNCKLSTACNALQFGSETAGDFRKVRVSNIEIVHAYKAGIGITSNDGGTIEDVVIENVTMRKVATPIFINITARGRTPDKPPPGAIRNVTIRNVVSTDSLGNGKNKPCTSTLSGLPEHPIENITLENVKITYKGGEKKKAAEIVPPYPMQYQPRELGVRPAYGFFVRHARGLVFRNVEVGFEAPDERPAVVCFDADRLVFEAFKAQRAAGADSLVFLKDARNVSFQNFEGVENAKGLNATNARF